MFLLESIQPFYGPRPEQLWLRLLRESQVEGGVQSPTKTERRRNNVCSDGSSKL